MARFSLNPLRWFGAGRARTAFPDLAPSRVGPVLESYGYQLFFCDSRTVEYIRHGKSAAVEYDPVTKLLSAYVEVQDHNSLTRFEDELTRINLWTIVPTTCPDVEIPANALVASNLKLLESSLDLLALMLRNCAGNVLLGEPESVSRAMIAHEREHLEYNRGFMLRSLPAEMAVSCQNLSYDELRPIHQDWMEKRRSKKQ